MEHNICPYIDIKKSLLIFKKPINREAGGRRTPFFIKKSRKSASKRARNIAEDRLKWKRKPPKRFK